MRWCCFLFWFIYRLTLSCLAHFNWLVAVYVNCAYFVLWKTYDLLWFWMHLTLCLCFKPLRNENYLIVWCNLIWKRRTRYPDKTYKEIYLIEYGKKKKTKAECELERINTAEARERERDEHSSSSDDEGFSHQCQQRQSQPKQITTSDKTESEEIDANENKYFEKVSPKEIMAEEEKECMEQVFIGRAFLLYPELDQQDDDMKECDVPPACPPRTPPESSEQIGDAEAVLPKNAKNWLPLVNLPQAFKTRLRSADGVSATTEMVAEANGNSANTSNDAGRNGGIILRKFLPKAFTNKRNYTQGAEVVPLDVLLPDFTNPYDLKTKKQMIKREKRDRKALAKRLRARRRAELAIVAKREARERRISSAIELLLQLLRMMTSFAILVGNIRKTFIPAQFKFLKPGQNAYDNPGLLMLFRCTVFLDVLLFWTNVVWAYCLQWHLCCRLGLIRFWMWTLVLITVGGLAMLFPMSHVQKNLDISWCRFMPNSTLAKYQPYW
uniref:Uncharacterized protein n=1 Tax=Parascaris univalens TaxID=6257 RepID=A0A914ZSQ4_PARUN